MKVVEKKEDFDADPALVSDQAAARLDPAGFDPGAGAVSDILERAADLIEPEGRWTQGGSGECGQALCAFRAIGKVGSGSEADNFFRCFMDPKEKGFSIVLWNDHPKRTQAEVVAKLREAAAKAREQGK